MTDAAEIARGLTKAQKRALIKLAEDRFPPSHPRFDVACRLDDAGLLTCENWALYGLRRYPAIITPLGRAVAEHLRRT
jgi:hypothetical protein